MVTLHPGLGLLIPCLLALLVVLVPPAILQTAAGWAGVERATFLRALLAVLLMLLVGGLASIVLGLFFPLVGHIAGGVLGALVEIVIIMLVFRTSLGRAGLTWLLQIVVVALIAAVLLGIAIALGLLTGGRRFF
jgi:hypothetical protein